MAKLDLQERRSCSAIQCSVRAAPRLLDRQASRLSVLSKNRLGQFEVMNKLFKGF